MDFRFSVNELFKEPIVKITNTLLTPQFIGDRRQIRECQTNVTTVINAMGEASAAAQGLSKPITTADRLRSSDQILYLLVDRDGDNGKGCVTGLLKVGRKNLYVFDPAGCNHQVKPLCILDFYIHESRQRTGMGRRLFEHMLKEEDVEAVRLAIDRPSPKFLSFLTKHYGLSKGIPQMNNFVVFDGFFVPDDDSEVTRPNNNSITWVKSTKSENANKLHNGLNSSLTTPALGRYGAPRPPCSMGQIIHNLSSQLKAADSKCKEKEVTISQDSSSFSPKLERPRSLSLTTSGEPEDPDLPIEDIQLEENILIEADQNWDKAEAKSEISEVESHISGMTVDSLSSEAKENRILKTASNLTERGYVDLKFYHSKLW